MPVPKWQTSGVIRQKGTKRVEGLTFLSDVNSTTRNPIGVYYVKDED